MFMRMHAACPFQVELTCREPRDTEDMFVAARTVERVRIGDRPKRGGRPRWLSLESAERSDSL
jgi:hypothetical protein